MKFWLKAAEEFRLAILIWRIFQREQPFENSRIESNNIISTKKALNNEIR